MQHKLVWDEAKREANLAKHGLDFADAADVLESTYRFDVQVVRHGETRTQSFSYVMGCLRVLTLVHAHGSDDTTRVISFRRASTQERENYHDWLSHEQHDT
jgi:uncharacterized DUF497 family protein